MSIDTSVNNNRLATIVLVCAVTLTGLSAGFFATYSYSVTRALGIVPDDVYVLTFQAINATVRSPEFGLLFFGSLPALGLALVLHWRRPGVRVLLCLAAISYLATLIITFTFHIPLNDELARVDAATDATSARAFFEQPWNQMHLVRTMTACVSFVLAVVSLAMRPPIDNISVQGAS